MKFKAMVSEYGKHLLERQFLPCLERHGKLCRALLSPTELHLVQTTEESDGMLISLRLTLGTLLEASSWTVQSRHLNLIGFRFQVDHLKGALKAASNSNAEVVELRLTTRSKPGQPSGQSQPKPYLCLTSKGTNSNMTHDIPIGKVFAPDEIDELSQLAEVSNLCPCYMDIQGEHMRLQALVDKLKSMDSIMTLVTTKQGFLYLQVAAPGIQLASEVQGLEIVPAGARDDSSTASQASSPEARLQGAMQAGLGQSAVVQMKHFARSLHSSQAAQPAKLLLGIAESGGHVHFMFVFASQSDEGGYNPDITLSYKLPVRDED